MTYKNLFVIQILDHSVLQEIDTKLKISIYDSLKLQIHDYETEPYEYSFLNHVFKKIMIF